MNQQKLLKPIQDALKHSSFLKDIAKTQKQTGYRSLKTEEIEQLEANHNWAKDWKKVKVKDNFVCDHIRYNQFHGLAFLGFYSGKRHPLHAFLSTGVSHTSFGDVVIEDECLVHRCGSIHRFILSEGSVSTNNTKLEHHGKHAFPINRALELCNEVDSIKILPLPELDINLVAALCENQQLKTFQQKYHSLHKQYAKKAKSEWSVIGPHALLDSCGSIENVYLGPHSIIKNLSSISNCIILSTGEEQTQVSDASIVQDSILQCGSSISGHSHVSSCFLAEQSSIGRHGLVKNAYIGPNTHISESEITSSVLGPFIGQHHHSLLISCYWPEGKGNVGYGANIGSNHTGRAPDQELHAAEGMFFGLASSIKYPGHYRNAPYSIISTSVTMLPQRLEMPFSLINLPSQNHHNISPAYNEIIPGWVIGNNIYMILRNQNKFIERNKAKHTEFPLRIIRADIAEMVIEARNQLNQLEGQDIYTDQDYFGLGKNTLSEKSRITAIQAYNFFLEWFCCESFYRFWLSNDKDESRDFSDILKRKSKDADWELARKLWPIEVGCRSTPEALHEYLTVQRLLLKEMKQGRKRDIHRSVKVFGEDALQNKVNQDKLIRGFDKNLKSLEKELDL